MRFASTYRTSNQSNLEGSEKSRRSAGSTTVLQASKPEAFLHWLAFTVPTFLKVEEVFENVIGLPKEVFSQRSRGKDGYKSVFSNLSKSIFVFSDGGHGGMGHHVRMTGQACEAFGEKILDFPSRVHYVEGKFSRVDLAIDDTEGILDMSNLEYAIKNGHYTSLFRSSPRMEIGYKQSNGKEDGKSIKFGKRTSNTYLRIYDKGAEAREEKHWIRVEIEAKGENADRIMKQIKDGKSLGEMLMGLLDRYICFREHGRDKNKTRWPKAVWWTDFLGDVETVHLGTGKKEKGRKDLFWFVNHYDKSLARVVDELGPWIIDEMLKSGRRKLTK